MYSVEKKTRIPFSAIAADPAANQVPDTSELRDDIELSNLIGTRVVGAADEELGTVEDVLISSGGDTSLVIGRDEADDDPRYEKYQETFEDDDFGEVGGTDVAPTVNGEEEPLEPSGANGNTVAIDWSEIDYDAETGSLNFGAVTNVRSVNMDEDAADRMMASEVLGLEVNLADEESFGEVEEVLIDPSTGRASAVVVDSMEFFNKKRYAVPVNFRDINVQDGELDLQHTQEDFEAMGEFKAEDRQAQN